jgi:TonB family protein
MSVKRVLVRHHSVAFTLLPDRKPPWRWFGSAFGIECVVIMLLIWIPVLFPQRLEAVKRYWVTPITAPPVVAWKPQPVKLKPVPVKQPVFKKPIPKPQLAVAPPPKPKLIAPVFTSPVAHPSVARHNNPTPAPEVAKAFPDNRPMSMGSSALPTLKRPKEQVQTGGFGDPNGVPGNNRTNHAANIARLGSYDLPNGPGYGNGTGGAKGARGTVASAGFGNGVAIGGSGGGSGHGSVQQGVFADEHPVNAPKVRPAAATTARTEPVEILYKPKPVYTDEARQRRIEGEVLLQVAFSATGHLEVLRVIKGLGYGLDDAAVTAARQIRFKPAREDGQPVDSLATVHILFELA